MRQGKQFGPQYMFQFHHAPNQDFIARINERARYIISCMYVTVFEIEKLRRLDSNLRYRMSYPSALP